MWTPYCRCDGMGSRWSDPFCVGFHKVGSYRARTWAKTFTLGPVGSGFNQPSQTRNNRPALVYSTSDVWCQWLCHHSIVLCFSMFVALTTLPYMSHVYTVGLTGWGVLLLYMCSCLPCMFGVLVSLLECCPLTTCQLVLQPPHSSSPQWASSIPFWHLQTDRWELAWASVLLTFTCE